MLLYHYSKTPLTELTTRRYRNEVTDKEKKEAEDMMKYRCSPAPYYDHISFFFDPAPLDVISEIYNNKRQKAVDGKVFMLEGHDLPDEWV